MDKEQLIEWLSNNNRYQLLWNEKSNIKELMMSKYLIETLDKILQKTAKEILKLSETKGYSKMGVGDTATDEAIVSRLYTLIH